MTLKESQKAPDFKMPSTSGKDISLKDYKGQYLVLYFYPRDDTPGCTKEACAFSEGLPKFSSSEAAIIGVSKDSIESHEKFKKKYNLNFELASDTSDVCEKYGVWAEKNMYGRKYFGIQRATFLIDPNGKIIKIWPKVKVPGHADDVLAAIQSAKQEAA